MIFKYPVQKCSTFFRGLHGFQTGKLEARSCLLLIDLQWNALGFRYGRWSGIFSPRQHSDDFAGFKDISDHLRGSLWL